MQLPRNSRSCLVSVGIHLVVLVALTVAQYTINNVKAELLIESVMAPEEREREEFEKELDDQKEIAESLNFVAGSVSTRVGGSNAPLNRQQKLEVDDVVQEPDVEIRVSTVNLPGLDRIGEDLGEEAVTGEVGAIVEGYGAALDRLTQELLRMMRSSKVLAVWMFDESESMKDDQEDIKGRIHRVYEELKLVADDADLLANRRRRKEAGEQILLTAVTSFGDGFHVHTPKPTADVKQILQAIDRVPVDRTGHEHMCNAILGALQQYGKMTRGRKVVLIIVSDESGDDGDPYLKPGINRFEDAMARARSLKTPLYIMGREAVFGNFYAYVRWKHPQTGHVHKLPIRRGPEAPSAEQLLFDGFRRRFDAHMSGFGPYEQVRLARDTGGIFFQLPHEEQNLNDLDDREYAALAMREYLPNLNSRRRYMQEVQESRFRLAIRSAIGYLNPFLPVNKDIEVPEVEHFVVNPAQSGPKVQQRLNQIKRVLLQVHQAHQAIDSVRELRDSEPSVRWRANYDLIDAQLFAYKVRLFEYGIAIEQFYKSMPRRIASTMPLHNRWEIRHGAAKLIMPDPVQEKLLGVTADELVRYHKQALDQLASVEKLHPGTPWATRAKWEQGRRFGATFRSWHYKPPPPRPRSNKPKPKPIPVPNL